MLIKLRMQEINSWNAKLPIKKSSIDKLAVAAMALVVAATEVAGVVVHHHVIGVVLLRIQDNNNNNGEVLVHPHQKIFTA